MEQYAGNNDYDAKEKRYRRIILILSIAIGILALLLIYTGTRVRTIVVKSEQVSNEKLLLQSELDSLLNDHDRIKSEYGHISKSLLVKDSVIQANANEIKELLAYKYDYNKVKKKLDLLRNITQKYVHQIDSLLTVNKSLKNENIEIRENLNKEKERSTVLTKEKESLTEKVSIGSLLKAYNITSEGVRIRTSGKQLSTEKARRTDAVKVCFTLSENPITEPGPKTVYLRIARPDNKIVTEGTEASAFIFNGQPIQYTLKQEIDYQNKSQNICMLWKKKDKDKDAMPGTYNVAVFVDGYEIGKGSFELK
jgi:cell division protein FtsL